MLDIHEEREGRTHSIYTEGVASGEEQVVSSGKLPVKPDMDIDDGYTHKFLESAEVWQILPGLGHLLLQHIHCRQIRSSECFGRIKVIRFIYRGI